jgi:hypothetical protein
MNASISKVSSTIGTSTEIEPLNFDPGENLISFPQAYCKEENNRVECTCCDGPKASNEAICRFFIFV